MPKPTAPPNLADPHLAIGLHCKVFVAHPDWVWHNDKKAWFDASKPATDVLSYEDRVRGRFLPYGNKLKADGDAGYVVLALAVAYLEGNQQFREGTSSLKQSRKFFCRSLKRVFPTPTRRERNRFYAMVRCGLFHDGMPKKGIKLDPKQSAPVVATTTGFTINANEFLDAIR